MHAIVTKGNFHQKSSLLIEATFMRKFQLAIDNDRHCPMIFFIEELLFIFIFKLLDNYILSHSDSENDGKSFFP